MPRFKYSTWIILIAIFGLGWGASFAAGLAWSSRILPDEESAAPARSSAWTGAGASSGRPPAGAASRSQAAQVGSGVPSRQGAGASSAPSGASPAGARQASAARAGSAARNSMGRGVFGTIQTVAGDTLTVTGQSGPVKVKLSEKTAVQKRTAGSRETTPGSRQDLKAGVRVTVQGPAGDDGTINAQTIQVLPAGTGQSRSGRGGRQG